MCVFYLWVMLQLKVSLNESKWPPLSTKRKERGDGALLVSEVSLADGSIIFSRMCILLG